MKPLDPDLASLLNEWIAKAEADLEAAEPFIRLSFPRHMSLIVCWHASLGRIPMLRRLLTT